MRSDAVKTGTQQAPHRSLFNALGMTKEEMDRPLVGIVSSYNEIVPGHMNLDKIAQAVKLGVAMAGGTPVMFPAIAVCDGIAMGHVGMKYSLVTRDLIADSTEAMAMAHQFDALVMIPNCDKNVPGLLMAAARLNVPTVFVSGGPMLAGHVNGHKTSLSSMFEAVGAYAAGKLDEEGLTECEMKIMSYLWILFRYVHSKLHELSDRSSWYGPERKRNHSCCIFRTYPSCKTCRYAGYGNVQKEYPSKRYHDKRSNPQCPDSRHGTWMLYKQYASSSGYRS